MEIWKDIPGYEGIYQVSTSGRVKSLKFGKERILKPIRNNCGYLQVELCKNGECKRFYVHRLVAQVFLPNPNNLPEVNHIDEDKINNRVENLEFCDRIYNINYGTRTDKYSKPVLQFNKDGTFIREWKSVKDVERNLGYIHQNISYCCVGRYKTAYGYVWKYKERKD